MAEALLAELEGLDEIPADLLKELEHEVERNKEATRLAKQREIEAKEARQRAAKSQETMTAMLEKYDQIKDKVEATRKNLAKASLKVERQEQLSFCLKDLKIRAERVAETRRALDHIKRHSNMPTTTTSNEFQPPMVQKTGCRADYALTVQRLQEKLANKKAQEETALSEEIVETNMAKLLAMKKEKEALEAEEIAKVKEKEAQEMRKKVENMQKLLTERKNKLKMTETAAEYKGNVVKKIEKILHKKERRANYVEKKKIENIVFGNNNSNT